MARGGPLSGALQIPWVYYPTSLEKLLGGRVWRQEEQHDPQSHREVEANLGCLTPVLAEGVQGEAAQVTSKGPINPL